MRVLVLGASGMLGHMAMRVLAQTPGLETFGTLRDAAARARLPQHLRPRVAVTGDLVHPGAAEAAFAAARPDVILNAAGVLKAADAEATIAANALLPHRLARLAAASGARLIHISTDCVFTGTRGNYAETDPADANDLYGRAKRLGEPPAPALTLRTSLIGPELPGQGRGLLAWFLAQPGPVPSWSRAIFSGLPTVTFARLIRDRILPRPDLTGTWHVAAEPIDKARLLALVAERWPHPVAIAPVAEPVVDRSLDGGRFAAATGWTAPAWPALIAEMSAAR